MFHKYSKKMKLLYENKMKEFDRLHNKYQMEQVHFFIPHTGIFIYVELPEYCQARKLVEALRIQGVMVSGCENMFLQNYLQKNVFRISLSSANTEEIRQGVAIISQEIQKLLHSYERVSYRDIDIDSVW
jgi:DNA-binding transcriptional MocR family regulator